MDSISEKSQACDQFRSAGVIVLWYPTEFSEPWIHCIQRGGKKAFQLPKSRVLAGEDDVDASLRALAKEGGIQLTRSQVELAGSTQYYLKKEGGTKTVSWFLHRCQQRPPMEPPSDRSTKTSTFEPVSVVLSDLHANLRGLVLELQRQNAEDMALQSQATLPAEVLENPLTNEPSVGDPSTQKQTERSLHDGSLPPPEWPPPPAWSRFKGWVEGGSLSCELCRRVFASRKSFVAHVRRLSS